jgi:2-oxoacid:acceptor oxidoreductase delta subunit (pyruvate/2-ketoisovalerate family)
MNVTEGGATEAGSSKKTKTGGWRTFRPVIDKSKCTGCMICVRFCPEGAIKLDKNKKADVDYDFCKGCGICFNACPVKAYKMELEEK